MKVLVDLHHFELFYSLQLLFEKRLGWELYRPIGMEWYEQKYWHVFNHPATAAQYLGLHQAKTHPTDIRGEPLPSSAILNLDYRIEDGIYYIVDPTKEDTINRGITLDKFKETKFDILISSIPQHIQPFNELIQKYQPQAKHIFQVGNAWGQQVGVKNLLVSTNPFNIPGDINACFYHQEFDLGLFKYEPPTIRNKMYSYIHYLQNIKLFDNYRRLLPSDWVLKSFGAGQPQNIMKTAELARQMIDSAFTWHYKPEGDGYGHVAFNTYAVGRPAVVWAPFYNGKLAGELYVDNMTCIDISKGTVQDNIVRLLRFTQPEEHNKMCEAAHQRFKNIVNFDEEEIKIRKFLENLR